MEEWKQIEGYEGMYEVSNLGNIRSLDRIVTATNKNGTFNRVLKGRILRNSKTTKGYPQIAFSKNGKLKSVEIHRLVAKAFIPNPDNLIVVNHIDGNIKNNNVTNLEWCTHSYNSKHAYMIGTKKPIRGEENVQSVLTDKEVIEIRRLNASGYSQRKLGKMFNVCHSTIRKIILRKKWKHI